MSKLKPSSNLLLPTLAAIVGFSANLAQVSLFRFFMGLFYGTEMHLGIFLAIWLAGISCGGYFGGKKVPLLHNLLTWLGATTFFAAAVMLTGYRFLPDPQGGFLPFLPVVIFMCLCVFPVSFFIGMLLPSLLSLSNRSLGLFYSYEAVGSFFGGVFFSFILGGTASPIICLLSLPIVLLTASILKSPGRLKSLILILVLVPAVYCLGPDLARQIEENYWKVANSSQNLLETVETPYQKLQLCNYHEQKSLFSNGMFSCSWPIEAHAEQLVHSFVTALKSFRQVLVLGAPPPDVIDEFLKYPDLKLTIVELDPAIVRLYGYSNRISSEIRLITDDPRRFLNTSNEKFDGIMIYPVSPVTLAGNRLFTIEAFAAVKKRLSPDGVLSLQVSGTENYLGTIKEQIILSTWQALGKIFNYRQAFPGSTITFFACEKEGIVPDGVKAFINRFKERKVKTMTFFPVSFFNILQPFRVKELEQWLGRPADVRLNTDIHPESFAQQLELWNIYSGGKANELFNWLLQRKLPDLIGVSFIGALLLTIISLASSASRAVTLSVTAGVAISGATGLLCEIILILLYQNSYGAAYRMTAFFFGIYMLGLASGAWLFGHKVSVENSFTRLKLVKFFQIIFTLAAMFLTGANYLHGSISIAVAIFFIAFLDGIEFPVADVILRNSSCTSSYSAGLLLFADNFGALAAGLFSGLWLLPAIGMHGCFILLGTLLFFNLIILLILNKRFTFAIASK